MLPHPLSHYDWLVVNTSGGKDSQTAMRYVVQLAETAGVKDRVVAFHADLGAMEWPGTKELARQQSAHYGLEFHVEQYRDQAGDYPTLLDYVRKRGKWPDSKNRYCTSEFKRGPCGRLFTLLTRRHELATGRRAREPHRVKILNVFGFRAEESPARAKRAAYAANTRFSNSKRQVWDWLPIHKWTEERVWQDIRASGVPHHAAYDLGMPRLSCSL